jgi:hypothetical protein
MSPAVRVRTDPGKTVRAEARHCDLHRQIFLNLATATAASLITSLQLLRRTHSSSNNNGLLSTHSPYSSLAVLQPKIR